MSRWRWEACAGGRGRGRAVAPAGSGGGAARRAQAGRCAAAKVGRRAARMRCVVPRGEGAGRAVCRGWGRGTHSAREAPHYLTARGQEECLRGTRWTEPSARIPRRPLAGTPESRYGWAASKGDFSCASTFPKPCTALDDLRQPALDQSDALMLNVDERRTASGTSGWISHGTEQGSGVPSARRLTALPKTRPAAVASSVVVIAISGSETHIGRITPQNREAA